MRPRVTLALALAATVTAAAHVRQEPQAAGTGTIAGRVVEAGTDRPVAGAQLWMHQTRGATAAGIYPRSEQLTADSSGAFAFRNLPAGQFSIQVSAAGYLPGAIGRRRPEGEEAWITLNEGQTFSPATIELFRGGTISGVVTNDRRDPLTEIHIETWARGSNGRLEHRHGAKTDAAGAYRITAVPAGDHFVVARVWHDTMRQGPPATEPSPCDPPLPPWTPWRPAVVQQPTYAVGEWFSSLPRWIPAPAPDDRGHLRTIPTTIYPGVLEVAQASAVSVRGGEERTGIDLQLRPTVTTTVHGRIVPLPGKSIANGTEVRLRLPGAPSDLSEHRTWAQRDHTFRFLSVVSGSYVLEVQQRRVVSCDLIERSSEDVLTERALDVPPSGLDNLVVPIASGATMNGQIHFDGTAARPELIDIWLTPASGGEAKHGVWDEGGRITAAGLVAGGYALQVAENGEPRWFVRSITLGRLDLSIHPLRVNPDGASGVAVTMTDRPSPLDGVIVDAAGNVVRDATVVVFPVDRDSWPMAQDQLFGFARARSLDGTYRFAHLVPGDYLVAAVDERQMGEWPRARFLEAVAKQASPVRIAGGEPRTLKLTLVARERQP